MSELGLKTSEIDQEKVQIQVSGTKLFDDTAKKKKKRNELRKRKDNRIIYLKQICECVEWKKFYIFWESTPFVCGFFIEIKKKIEKKWTLIRAKTSLNSWSKLCSFSSVKL